MCYFLENSFNEIPYFLWQSLIMTALSFLALFKMVLLIWENENRAWIAVFSYMAAPGLYAMVATPPAEFFYYKSREIISSYILLLSVAFHDKQKFLN
ncbi:MAG: hypothetical protein JJT78_12315 [Leptospira sp.]|nr:hypothetical protein [Leptospira sp.]